MNRLPQPIRALLDLFSSVKLGITLLVVLFVYSSVGSAGILYPTSLNIFDLDAWAQVVPRQWRGLEMTEYEWFVWWPFTLLIALICINITVTTLRRIPFRPVNFGVWTIHTGIIVLALGSIWYFTAKLEGDAPVARRQLIINVPGHEPQRVLVKPGNRVIIGEGDGTHVFEISRIDPHWTLLSGPDAGEEAYAVSVRVITPDQTFIRQLLAGYPEFTEDVIPGQGRAVVATGERLLDDSISLTLEYDRQPYFYLVHSDAIYLRELGSDEWVERPIPRLPRYNDYIGSLNEVWLTEFGSAPPLDPLEIAVPAVRSGDPLPDVTLRIGSYLRYAVPRQQRIAGGEEFSPLLVATFDSGQRRDRITLLALDAASNTFAGGFLRFAWAQDESAAQELIANAPPQLRIEVPEQNVSITVPVDDVAAVGEAEVPFRPIEGTAYSYRVSALQERFRVQTGGPLISVAIVELKSPEREVTRWVFDDTARNRDHVAGAGGELQPVPLDESIRMQYVPSTPLLLIGGPAENQLRLASTDPGTLETTVRTSTIGEALSTIPGLSLEVEQFAAHSTEVEKPLVVPPAQRDRDFDMQLRMIRVEFPGPPGEPPVSKWLTFHNYPFASSDAALRRHIYEPQRVALSDGRTIEILYSRECRRLPAPVVLEDFDLVAHVGGFTGQSQSIRDWRSRVRFVEDAGLSAEMNVSVNDPAEFRGFWFFQSAWDPPQAPTGPGDPGSAGLNYTVLGVGNREGVYVQLLGCTIAVLGMLYAFYVKPIMKRRRRERVESTLRTRPDAAQPHDTFAATPDDNTSNLQPALASEEQP